MNYLLIYFLLILIILFFSYYNSLNQQENFTPHIRRFYRPYLRQARMLKESFYDRTKEHVNRILRKTGLTK